MKKLFWVLLLLLATKAGLNAQITPQNGTNFRALAGTTSLPHLFTANNGATTWSIDEAVHPFVIELDDESNGGLSEAVTLTFNPDAAATMGGTYHLRVANGLTPIEITTELITRDPSISRPIDVVFVIDVSGSMNEDAVCAGQATPTTPQSKLTYLKRELRVAFNQLRPYMAVDPRNRLGIVTFSSTAPTPHPLNLTPFNDPAISSTVNGLLGTGSSSIQASGATSLGAGINAGIALLGPDPGYQRQKYILLFTNGIQNTSPWVSINATTNRVEIDGSPLVRDVVIIPYAIFAPNDRYNDLLVKIAEANTVLDARHVALQSSPHICDIDMPLRQNWVNAAATIGSPKIVDFRTNTLSGNTASEIIKVEENMDRLSIAVDSPENLNIGGVIVEKKVSGNFVPINSFGTIEPAELVSSAHRIFSILFTPSTPGGNVSSGEYRVRFTSSMSNIRYKIVSIVDDRGLKQTFFASPKIAAGETMFLGTRLFQAGNPVSNANVKAIIYKPKKSLGTGFARKNVPGQFIKVEGQWSRPFWPKLRTDFNPKLFYQGEDDYIKQISITHPSIPSFLDNDENDNRTIGEKKHVVLLKETDYSKTYAQEIVATIPLPHEANGIYKAIYQNTQKTGLYHVRFEARGTHPVIGSYFRFEEATPLVVFGTPDRKRSTLCLVYENPLVLLIRPVDIHGNLLGPNQVDAINIEMSAGSSSSLVDYLDGRYMVRLFVPDGVDPEIGIRINGRTLYDGLLSKICRQRWFFQVAAGKPNAAQNLELNYDGHWFAEASLGYRLNWSWALQAKGGFYQFKGIQTANTHVVGLNLGLAYRTWTNYFGGLYLSPELNAGFYQRKGADWKFGYNYGLGLHRQLSHRLDLVIQYGQHAFDQGAAQERFSTLGAGLRLKF